MDGVLAELWPLWDVFIGSLERRYGRSLGHSVLIDFRGYLFVMVVACLHASLYPVVFLYCLQVLSGRFLKHCFKRHGLNAIASGILIALEDLKSYERRKMANVGHVSMFSYTASIPLMFGPKKSICST